MKKHLRTGFILSRLLLFLTARAAEGLPVEALLLGYESPITSRNLSANGGNVMTTSIVANGVVLHWHRTDPHSSLVSATRAFECDTGFPDFNKFKVHLIGTADRNGVCNALLHAEMRFRHKPNIAIAISDEKLGTFYRTVKAWYLLTFDQDIVLNHKTMHLEADLPRYHPELEDKWGVSQHGALVHYMQGEVHVYAPGEVISTDSGTYTVKAKVSEEDLFVLRSMQMAKKIGNALRQPGETSVADAVEAARREGAEVTVVKKPDSSGKHAPAAFMFVVLGLAAIGGIMLVRLVAKWVRPRRTGALPTPEGEYVPFPQAQLEKDDKTIPPPI